MMRRERIRESRSVRRGKRRFLYIMILLVICWCFPTWTPKIEGENSICEYRKVFINGSELQLMIRGKDKNNPILLFVHGGPCCSEIPYVRKYQEKLEESFTIVHYDQRGSGKSFRFDRKYESITVDIHKQDLIQLTEYLEEYLEQDKVILLAHSYGTYFATMAAAERPDLYRAYVGIGQMSDVKRSETDTLSRCIVAAQDAGNTEDVEYLQSLRPSVEMGSKIVPRKYVRKYGMAARKIDETKDYLTGFFLNPEYNLSDLVRFYTASYQFQEALIAQALQYPITDMVHEINIPVYFIMGQYDGMTSPIMANAYLGQITGEGTKEMLVFQESAHYPQFEEEERFRLWMIDTFGNG